MFKVAFEVRTVYRSFPELYCLVDTKEEADELVAELKENHDLDDAYYDEVKL